MPLAHRDRKHEGSDRQGSDRQVACAVPAPVATRGAVAEWISTWVPVILSASAILVASGEGFAALHTRGWLAALLRLGFGDVAPGTFRQIHLAVRNSAHLIEYGIFAVLLCRGFQRAAAGRLSALWQVAVWLIPCVLAVVDEAHQFTLPSRTGSIRDVGIDSLGAWLGLTAWWWRARWR